MVSGGGGSQKVEVQCRLGQRELDDPVFWDGNDRFIATTTVCVVLVT